MIQELEQEGWTTAEELRYIKNIGSFFSKCHPSYIHLDRNKTEIEKKELQDKTITLRKRLLANYIHYALKREEWNGVDGEQCIAAARNHAAKYK